VRGPTFNCLTRSSPGRNATTLFRVGDKLTRDPHLRANTAEVAPSSKEVDRPRHVDERHSAA
jgi:hypothetical protein